MERQSKEDSLALWEFEKNNVKQFGSNNCLTNKYIEDGE